MKLMIAISGCMDESSAIAEAYGAAFDAEASWFSDLSEKAKALYLKLHPNSKYGDDPDAKKKVAEQDSKQVIKQLKKYIKNAEEYFDNAIRKEIEQNGSISKEKRERIEAAKNGRIAKARQHLDALLSYHHGAEFAMAG